MPQYIEFNKETTLPASTTGTNNLGVNSDGNVVLTNTIGVESVVGYINPLAYDTYVAKLTQQSEGVLYSGLLTVGKTYNMTGYSSGDDFSNVADVQYGTINTNGCSFIATGTTPSNWTNGTEIEDALYPLPSILENTLPFTPYWKRIQAGTYFFNFPYGIDYNKLRYKFTPTSTSNTYSTIAINPSEYSFGDSNFYPNNKPTGFNSVVYATVIQPDGKIVCGGNFSDFDGTGLGCIARLNSDGTLDNTFSTAGFDALVFSLAIQSNGKILCGGDFSQFDSSPIANCIARLDSNGNLDTTFNTNAGTGFNGRVWTIVIQLDGKIVCGGDFTTYNGDTVPTGIVRLNSDGTLETTFNNGGAGVGEKQNVQSIAIQSDGKIVCGGRFDTYNGSAVAGGIMRLNTDGTLDTAFNTNAGTGFDSEPIVNTVVIQSDGKILCGGSFLYFDGNNASYIARLNADGTYDAANYQGFDGAVRTIKLDAANNAFVGGEFIQYALTSLNYITRLDNSGSLINAFNNGFNDAVYTISQQSDGRIIVGGNFDTYNAAINCGCITRLYGSYDVVLTTGNSAGFDPLINDNQLINNPIEIKLYS